MRYSERRLIFGLFFISPDHLFFQESKTAYYQQDPQEDYPYFWRQKKCADGDYAKDQQHKTYVFGLFIHIKAFLFAKIIVHMVAP